MGDDRNVLWLQCLGQELQETDCLSALEHGCFSGDLNLLNVFRTGARLGWRLTGSGTCKGTLGWWLVASHGRDSTGYL